jgi:serpin B
LLFHLDATGGGMNTSKLVSASFAAAFALTLIFILDACRQDNIGNNQIDYGDEVVFSGVRNLSPDYTEDELKQFVADNNAFAFDLYHAIKDEAENLFFSPYSISVALAMTYGGARNRTEIQMTDTLRFNFLQEKLHALFNALDLELDNRNLNNTVDEDKYLKLKIANALWAQRNYTFLDSYLEILMLNYGAGIRLVDFVGNPEQARLTINDWVSDQTENRIENLLAEGDIDGWVRLVLTNTIYFSAAWAIPFNPDDTYDNLFYLDNGSTVTVPMMIPEVGRGENGEDLAAAEGPGWLAVDLPYCGGEFSMVIVVPDYGTYSTFEEDLDYALIDEIIGNLDRQDVTLEMPKFGYESKIYLAGILAEMGMPDAFIPGVADFSGIDGTLNLFIDKVIHQTFISVDEIGTEAAAASAVVMTWTTVPNPLEVILDRPFIYMIRDSLTGAILFLGRVKNPSGTE